MSVSALYAADDSASIPNDLSGVNFKDCDTNISYELDNDGDLAEILNNAQPGTSISLYGNYTLAAAATVKNGVSLYVVDGSPSYGTGSLAASGLTVAQGGTLWVDKGTAFTGDVANYGTVENYGTMNGNVTGNGTYITATLVKDADELRDAITNAADGAVIALDDDIVLNDTLNIGKSITLDGNGHTISTTDISTQIPAVNGETINYSAIIAATNNAKVVLKDLVVKGDPEKASTDRDLTHDTRYIGVAAINADLTMEGCEILDITYTKGSDGLQGMQNGFGVYAVSNSAQTVTLNNTKIENFNKAAVIARDKINLIVNGCTITGFGEQAIIGQNGIQYAGNATIQNTKISGLVYNAENEWKNCSTAIYNVSTGTTTNTILQNVVCENVDSSYYTTGGTTAISGGSYVHVGDGNAAVAGSEGVSIVITGGKFDSDVTEYLASGLVWDPETGTVQTPYVPSVPGETTPVGDYIVPVDATAGGRVTVSPGRADKGDTVTITVKPNDGYVLDELTVTAKSGGNVKLTQKDADKWTFTMPASQVSVAALFRQAGDKEQSNPFADVPESAWYCDAVLWAVENGITNGTSSVTFSPDVTVSRAQMVTFLWRAAGAPKATGSNPFTDVVQDAWYYDAVLWAVASGITNGTNAAGTTFSPDEPVSRAQAVTFQWRAAGAPAVSGSGFEDVAEDAYYAQSVIWAAKEGITVGTNAAGTAFSPDEPVSRAQAVTFLYRELAD